MKDYYKILGVSENATQEEIRKRYRELVRKYHPDINKDNPHATEIMAEINEAYEVLSNPTKRREYDLRRHLEESVNENYEQQSGTYNTTYEDYSSYGYNQERHSYYQTQEPTRTWKIPLKIQMIYITLAVIIISAMMGFFPLLHKYTYSPWILQRFGIDFFKGWKIVGISSHIPKVEKTYPRDKSINYIPKNTICYSQVPHGPTYIFKAYKGSRILPWSMGKLVCKINGRIYTIDPKVYISNYKELDKSIYGIPIIVIMLITLKLLKRYPSYLGSITLLIAGLSIALSTPYFILETDNNNILYTGIKIALAYTFSMFYFIKTAEEEPYNRYILSAKASSWFITISLLLYFFPIIHFAYISTLAITLAFVVSPASLKPITGKTLIKPEEWLIILTGGFFGTLIVLIGGIGISLAIPIFIIGSSISLVFSIGGIIILLIIYAIFGELLIALIKGVPTFISLSIRAAIKTAFLTHTAFWLYATQPFWQKWVGM